MDHPSALQLHLPQARRASSSMASLCGAAQVAGSTGQWGICHRRERTRTFPGGHVHIRHHFRRKYGGRMKAYLGQHPAGSMWSDPRSFHQIVAYKRTNHPQRLTNLTYRRRWGHGSARAHRASASISSFCPSLVFASIIPVQQISTMASSIVSPLSGPSPPRHDSNDTDSVASAGGASTLSLHHVPNLAYIYSLETHTSSSQSSKPFDTRSCVSDSAINSSSSETTHFYPTGLRRNEHLAVLLSKDLWKASSISAFPPSVARGTDMISVANNSPTPRRLDAIPSSAANVSPSLSADMYVHHPTLS